MSNCYCDVPLTYQTENNCHTHDNIVEVVNVIHCGIDENRVIRVARNDIELLPAPDVEPVKRGRWVHKIMLGEQTWFCSECKTIGSPQWKRCPVCEAKMIEEAQ